MEWRFDDFVLSSDRADLTGPQGPVRIEPHPFELLCLLAANADRVVSRDEIIAEIWQGRAVSDATVSTAIKQARRAVGDSGAQQSVIRTIHGRGFRFVAALQAPASAPPARARVEMPDTGPDAPRPGGIEGAAQPSIAVLRFQCFGGAPAQAALADAIPAELIASLSKLGWLRVIARGSSFRFDPDDAAPETVATRLGVRYLVTGSVEVVGDMLTLSVEVLSGADSRLIWSDRYATRLDEIPIVRRNIVASVIAALELHVPRHEADAAGRLTPAQFDAWSHYHLGLRAAYRFDPAGTAEAAGHFSDAIALDPEFARAHAGLSFTHWQTAFMLFGADRQATLAQAETAARTALNIDPHEPFANYNMGRARWLQGDVDSGVIWLDKALMINPNFAQCHYVRGITQLLSGQNGQARASADHALLLSPLDPLAYAMMSTRAMSDIAEDRFDDAARQCETAAEQPGAHFYIHMIAAAALQLAGHTARAARMTQRAQTQRADASLGLFFKAFPFRSGDMRARTQSALRQLGFPD